MSVELQNFMCALGALCLSVVRNKNAQRLFVFMVFSFLAHTLAGMTPERYDWIIGWLSAAGAFGLLHLAT